MSQNEICLKHMRRHGSLTTLVAFDKYDITRLPARIDELKKARHLINDVWIRRNGKRYKAYSLVEGKRARAAA